MRLLAFDCSTEILSAALHAEGRELVHVERAASTASERLLPAVLHLLREAGVAGTQLDAIAFGEGPGSFTGLRIACGVAQGLAEAWQLPLVPVSAFAAAAELARTRHGESAHRALIAFDARMREVYMQVLEYAGGQWYEPDVAQVAAVDSLRLPAAGVFGGGDAFARYPQLRERLGDALVGCDEQIFPCAQSMIALAGGALRAGRAVDPAAARPNYVRDKVAYTAAERQGQMPAAANSGRVAS